MPQFTLRHSANLKDINFIPFFREAHKELCEIIHSMPSACSSMVISHEQYLIANGDSDRVFVHLDILVKSGKYAAENLREASQALFKRLNDYLASENISNAKTSVHIFEASYFVN